MTAWEAALAPRTSGNPGGFRRNAWRRFRQNPAAVISAVLLGLLILVTVFASELATHDPHAQFLETPAAAPLDPLAERATGKFEAPSAEHWFGTDELARDIYSRTLYGLRISLAAALFAVVAVTIIGVAVGAGAAAGPRWVDGLLMRATDIAFAFPDLLLIILLRAALGDELFGRSSILGVSAGIIVLFMAISLTAWPTMARLVRAQLLVLREMEFSTAAESLGASRWRLATRHWLPSASAPVIVEATFLVPRAIFAEATLSFIGIGVTPPTPSLGSLIASHFSFVSVQWTGLAIPTLLLAALFLAFQFFGDGLRDALNPRRPR